MTARIRLRRADSANWGATVLDHGEVGLIYDEVDGNDRVIGFAIGDGTSAFSALPIMRPPVAGTRTGLGSDGATAEGGGDLPLSYDDIALLSSDNTFSGDNTFNGTIVVEADDPSSDNSLTVNGKLLVEESATDADDGNITVANGDITVSDGDVTLTKGELTIPLYADGDEEARDTNAVRGAATTTGGMVFETDGVRIGNSGVAPGKLRKDDFSEWGPFIQVKSDKVVVGGYDGADSTDVAKKTTLEYAAQPEDATLSGLSSDLIVPTKKQVVDHVTEAVDNPTDFQASYDPSNPDEGTEVVVGKWISGEDLYQRTITTGTVAASATILTVADMDALVECIPHKVAIGSGAAQVGWHGEVIDVDGGNHLHGFGCFQSGTAIKNRSFHSSDTYDVYDSIASGSILTFRYTKTS